MAAGSAGAVEEPGFEERHASGSSAEPWRSTAEPRHQGSECQPALQNNLWQKYIDYTVGLPNISRFVQGVSGLSKGVFKSTMTQVITDRQKRQEEDPAYRRALKEISHKLEQRVKERNTEQPARPKQHEQGQQLPLQFQDWKRGFKYICFMSILNRFIIVN